MTTTTPAGLGGDMLPGAEAISEFLFGTTGHRRKVYYLASIGVLPCFHMGATLCARKSVLLQWVEEQEAKGAKARNREAA